MRRPLFARQDEEAAIEWEGPYEGIPSWLFPSANRWLTDFMHKGQDLYGSSRFDSDLLMTIQRELRVSLDWRTTQRAMSTLLSHLADDKYGPAILDWCVSRCAIGSQRAAELDLMLLEAGSVWTIGEDEMGVLELQRRVDATTVSAARGAAPPGSRPAHHLAAAWSKVYGHSPDPSAGYAQAIKAIESAGVSIVCPNNPRATLGTMIADTRAAPGKWKTSLNPSTGGTGVGQLIEMMQLVWTAQLDRHGSATATAPLSVSASEAEAALHIAATLVHLFSSGAVSAV